MGTDYATRKSRLHALADYFSEPSFRDSFVKAYINDTAFTRKDVLKREIASTAALLHLPREEEMQMQQRIPLGKVAVFVPKNSLGLTLAKAIAGSYLAGNPTLVYFPKQLKESGQLYALAIQRFLPEIEIADASLSSALFMRKCLNDPEIKAIVVYGDDSWIDSYKTLAEQTRTTIIFEGPGNDPMVVMPDADLESAVAGAIEGGLNNGGQSCSAFERFFIHRSLMDAFADKLTSSLNHLQMGDPNKETTDVGPIASRVIYARMLKQIDESVAMGAQCICGGESHEEPETGLPVMRPAILTNCTIEMPVVANETFGPVFPLIAFDSVDDLLPKLDASNYGLNASVFGNAPEALRTLLESTHRNVYYNSTCVSKINLPSRLIDGGFRRSGLIWKFNNGIASTSTGIRNLALELSLPKSLN
jgi:acyl-CoA reductase-like NAD-dependent aldehyde dehydrogenase